MKNFNSWVCLLRAVFLSWPIPTPGWPINSTQGRGQVFPTKTWQQFMLLCATIRETSPSLSCKLKMMVKHRRTCPCDPWCSAALTQPSGRCQTPARFSASPAPLARRQNDVTYQFGWNKGQQSGWQKQNLTLSHLHSGNSCFLHLFLLVRSRSALSGGFAGQQGEFAMTVVHQVQNRVVTCFTRILHNSATNPIASLYHQASPRVLIWVLLVIPAVACLSFTVRKCLCTVS